MSEPSCASCRFSITQQTSQNDLLCRRHAPSPATPGKGRNRETTWPPVKSSDHCGEYKSKNRKGFLIPFLDHLSYTLRCLTLGQWLRWCFPYLENAEPTEAFVVLMSIFAFVLSVIAPSDSAHLLTQFVVIFAIWRVAEVIVYLVNVLLLFDQDSALRRGETYVLRGIRRSLILAGFNYAEVVIWFAFFYRIWDDRFTLATARDMQLSEVWGSLYHSFVTMSTLDAGGIEPTSYSGAYLIVLPQLVIAVFFVIFVFARLISWLHKPEAQDEP